MPRMTTAQPSVPPTFECSVCSRAFKRPDHLARHERAHSNSRPFRCGLCDRGFGRRDILLRHFSHVHRGKPLCEHVQADDQQQQQNQHQQHPATCRTQPISVSESSPSEQEEDVETTTTESSASADIDAGLAKVASLGESDLDDFLDALLGISSYTNLAQTLLLPPHQPLALSPLGDPQTNRRAGHPVHIRQPSGQHRTPRRRFLDNDRAHDLPSFHQNLFPQERLVTPAPHGLPAARVCPSLTQFTFGRLVDAYKDHCSAMLPFLHFPTLDLSFNVLSGESTQETCAQETCAQGKPCTRWKRRPHPTLVLSILALGALCDQKKALALELYNKTRKEILAWLAKVQGIRSEEAPPLHLLQAFINYICFGLAFGDQTIEELTVGHTVSFRSLVGLASLEKPTMTTTSQLPTTCKYCEAKAPTDWHVWAIREERKRTFFTYFSLMSTTLTYLDTVTSMDWRDVRHSMPCSDRTWLAETSQAWTSVFEGEPSQPLFNKEVQALFSDTQEGRTQENAEPESPTAPSLDHDTQAQTLPSPNAFSCFLLITALHREICHGRLQEKVNIPAMQIALQKWQTLWLQLAPQEEIQTHNPLVSCGLAMFDNTQLLLHVDVKEAREALVSRKFGKFCMSFPGLDLRLDSEGSGCSLSSCRDDWQQTYDIYFDIDRRTAFRHIAIYSVNALEMVFKGKPGWSSGKTGEHLSLHTGMAIFYCVQILTSWICFFANCLNRRLYADWLEGSDNSEELEDICLLQKLLAFAQNRKTQFKETFDVPSSPEALDEGRMGRLACDLLDLHSRIFCRCVTWPGKSANFIR